MGEGGADRGGADQDVAPAPAPRGIIDRATRWLTRADAREQKAAAEAQAAARWQAEQDEFAAQAQAATEAQAAQARTDREAKHLADCRRCLDAVEASGAPLVSFQTKERVHRYARREDWLAAWNSRAEDLHLCDSQGQEISSQGETATVQINNIRWDTLRPARIISIESYTLPEQPQESRSRGISM